MCAERREVLEYVTDQLGRRRRLVRIGGHPEGGDVVTAARARAAAEMHERAAVLHVQAAELHELHAEHESARSEMIGRGEEEAATGY